MGWAAFENITYQRIRKFVITLRRKSDLIWWYELSKMKIILEIKLFLCFWSFCIFNFFCLYIKRLCFVFVFKKIFTNYFLHFVYLFNFDIRLPKVYEKMMWYQNCDVIENLVKNRNFSQKYKFWWKIEILVKNRNFGYKSKF